MEVSSVGVCLCNKEGKVTHILFGLRNDSKKFTLPGGSIEKGESAFNAALRELKEEAGLSADPKQVKNIGSDNCLTPEGKEIVVHAHLLKIPAHKRPLVTPLKDPDKECSKLLWVPVKDGKLPSIIANNLHSKKNVVLQCMGIQEKNEEKMSKSGGQWAAMHNGRWYHLEDMYDDGIPAHQGGGNMYKLKGVDEPVHQDYIEDLAPTSEVEEHLNKSYSNSLNIGDNVEVRPYATGEGTDDVWNVYRDAEAIGSVKIKEGNVLDNWWSDDSDRHKYFPLIQKELEKIYNDSKPMEEVAEVLGLERFFAEPHEGSAHVQAFHPHMRKKLLGKIVDTLPKVAVLDYLLGYSDRHDANYLLCKQKPYLHLVNNSHTFNFKNWTPDTFGHLIKHDYKLGDDFFNFVESIPEQEIARVVDKRFDENKATQSGKALKLLKENIKRLQKRPTFENLRELLSELAGEVAE